MTSVDLYIEFDGSSITISSDVSDVVRLLRARYSHMLASRPSKAIGNIRISDHDSGCRITSNDLFLVDAAKSVFVVDFIAEQVLLQFMKARKELLWLHAAGVERSGKALIICGGSGRGKSTVSTILCESGWRFMSDDVIALRMQSEEALPFLQTPARRTYPGRNLLAEEMGILTKEEVDVSPESLRRTPAPIAAVIFPTFDPEATPQLIPVSRGDAALKILGDTRNIVDHQERAVSRVAGLVRQIQSYSLTFGVGGAGIELLNDLA